MALLSPGEWHKSVPRDLEGNLAFREHWLRRCNASKRVRTSTIEAYRNDFGFAVNFGAWQFNPKKFDQRVGPFITWPSQDRAWRKIFDCVEQGRDLVVEKSREEGASWLCVMGMDWLASTQERMQFLMVSRIAELVDGHTPDALFWKIDFLHDHLPEWLRPKVERLKMHIGYKGTNSTVTGMASTGDFAVGGRATAIFMDEFGKMKNAQEAYDRSADTSSCRIFNFTHTGPDTAAYRLSERDEVDKVRLHWSENPWKRRGLYYFDKIKNEIVIIDKEFDFTAYCKEQRRKHFEKPDKYPPYPEQYEFDRSGEPGGPYAGLRSVYYDAECLRRNSARAVAMDLDIDPKGSSDQFFDSIKIRQLINAFAKPPEWVGDFRYDRQSAMPADQTPLVARSGGLFHLWMSPEWDGTIAPGSYCIGADVSEGVGATPTCVTVADARTRRKVLEYVDAFINPDALAPMLVALARLFHDEEGNGARLVWECPGPGQRVGQLVIELGYFNIHYHTDEYKNLVATPTEKPGFYANSGKRWLLEEYREALQGQHFENRSEDALEECLSFRYVGNSVEHPGEKNKDTPSAGGVNHGDRTIADALAWMLVKKAGFGPQGAVTKQKDAEFPYMSLGWRRKYLDKQKSQMQAVWV